MQDIPNTAWIIRLSGRSYDSQLDPSNAVILNQVPQHPGARGDLCKGDVGCCTVLALLSVQTQVVRETQGFQQCQNHSNLLWARFFVTEKYFHFSLESKNERELNWHFLGVS